MLSIKGKEWGDIGCSRDSIVVCKLGNGRDFRSVVLLIINVTLQVLFQDGIDPFCLTIGFGVQTGRKVLRYTY